MTLYDSDIVSSYVAYHILICYLTICKNKNKEDCATKRGSVLKVNFFGHCAKRMAAQRLFSYDLIWEFTMMLNASDIVSPFCSV